MYLARFSYDVAPANRRSVRSSPCTMSSMPPCKKGLEARILIPLTRAQGGPALQFEVGLNSLDQLEEFRHRGAGSRDETSNWMHAFSKITACASRCGNPSGRRAACCVGDGGPRSLFAQPPGRNGFARWRDRALCPTVPAHEPILRSPHASGRLARPEQIGDRKIAREPGKNDDPHR